MKRRQVKNADYVTPFGMRHSEHFSIYTSPQRNIAQRWRRQTARRMKRRRVSDQLFVNESRTITNAEIFGKWDQTSGKEGKKKL